MTKAKLSWRHSLPIHPAAELLPGISKEELLELGKDIKKKGLTSAIVLWRPHPQAPVQLLDGRSRLDAIEMATGSPAVVGPPSITAGEDFLACDKVIVLDKAVDPVDFVISANIHRRHLTAEQRREVIAKLLKAQPDKSNRQIAKIAKVDDKTVASVRDDLESGAEIPHLNETTGADGKSYPAKKERGSKKPQRRGVSVAARLAAAKLIDEIGIEIIKRVLTALDEPCVWEALLEEVGRRAMNGTASENVEDRWIESDTL